MDDNKIADFLNGIKESVTEDAYSLIEKAINVFRNNECCDKDMPWGDNRVLLPSSTVFKGIWNWDTAFHAVGLSHFDTDFAIEHIEAFVKFQQDDGMFADVVMCDGRQVTYITKPPVMAWACRIVYERSKDLEFLKNVYGKLCRNMNFWEEKRCKKQLFHYDTVYEANHENRNHYVGCDSGWDNSVRWDNEPEKLWAVDLNCYMVMSYRALAFMADELKLSYDKQMFKDKAENLERLIEKYLWNEADGCYADRNYDSMEFSNVLSPASFMPLYIKTASKERAEKMLTVAKDKFYPGMPTVSYDNPEYSTDYWRGSTWLNVAYFAAKGLKNYGFDETADGIKNTILIWVKNDGDCIHENYNALTGEGLCADKFSWSAVFVMEFILNF